MLIQDWFSYLSGLLLTGGLNAKDATEDGDLLQICPCISRTDSETAEEENGRILKLYSNSSNLKHLSQLPNTRTIAAAETVFKLYTRNGPVNGTRVYAEDVNTVMKSGFDTTRPTVVATHGYLSNDHTEWMMQLKTAQLSVLDCNFLSIDWSKCANNCCYFGARDCAIIVGGYLETLLQTLVDRGANPEQFHLMGHSLGAHLVSQASSNGLQVGRITGFDPPKWGFNWEDSKHRIDPKDAIFVDIIHTSSTLGWSRLLGQMDFFPNKAGRQPGCSVFNEVCSHSMSYFYYIQSLYHEKKYPAWKCEDLNAALNGNCNGPVAYMGVKSAHGTPGVYYINVEEPATGEP